MRHQALHRRVWAALVTIRPTHPARIIVAAFALAVLVSTLLLRLPVAAEPGQHTSFRVALFTATSAVCVTGLGAVDTASHWSGFGEAVIVGSVQVGGFGIMTLASLLGLLVSRRLGLRTRLLTQAESNTLGLGDVGRILRGVAVTQVAVEATLAVVLWLRFWLGYDQGVGQAAWSGVFHAVSAFNNAGFSLYRDSLISFVDDPLVCLPLCLAVILGSVGYPVLLELRREWRSPRTWSLHTKMTVTGTVALLLLGWVAVALSEWTNSRTLGPLSVPGKLLASFTQGVMPRSAGFNSLDYGAMRPTTWLTTDALMFVGGGSAGTAGGIKITTFLVLLFAIVAEARGDRSVDAFGRAIPAAVVRQALTVALLGVALVAASSMTLLALTDLSLDRVLFEVISAFATAGLSTGVTGDLPGGAQYVLVALMFAGRLGTITLASALALRERTKLYALPEERPVVG